MGILWYIELGEALGWMKEGRKPEEGPCADTGYQPILLLGPHSDP